MHLKTALLTFSLLTAPAAALAQTGATVQLGTSAQPQSVTIQDRTGQKVPIGTINSSTHTWTPNGTAAPASGAGGSNQQIQFNNSGNLGGVPGFTWDGSHLTFPSGAVPTAGQLATRAAIATTAIGANQTVAVGGYRTFGDLGANTLYSSVGATSTGWNAIQDLNGVWFNQVLGREVNPGQFGAYADDGAHTISSGDISANPQWRGTYSSGNSWDYVATQEAIYASFAQGSTPGSIVWNYTAANYTLNHKLFIPSPNGTGGTAKYGINQQLLIVAANLSFEFANSATCWDWKGSTSVSMLFTDSVAYGNIWNYCLQNNQTTTVPGANAAVWALDYDGTYSGLKTHLLTIYNANIGIGGFNNAGISINAISGGSGQGDDIIFVNPEFSAFAADYCLWVNGANALGIQIIGGDMQGCTHDAIRNTNGAIFVRGTTMENQQTYTGFTPVINQIGSGGADFHSTGAFGGFTAENKLEDVRSEGDVGMLCDVAATCFADDVQVNAGDIQGGYFASYPYALGAVAGITAGTGAALENHAIMVVADGGPVDWNAPTTGSTGCTFNDTTQSWTTNAYAGYVMNFRFSNGATFQEPIVSNTGTSVTMSPCYGFAPTGGNAGLYHIGGNSGSSPPTWTSMPAGQYVTTLGGSIGYGFSTTASSTTIGIDGNLVGFLAVNDYVVIPGADEVCNFGNCVVRPLIARVVSINTGADTAVVSKAATITVPREAGYTATPITDHNLKWIDIPVSTFFGLANCRDSNSGSGLFTQVANMDNCGGAWAAWNKGPTSRYEAASGGQQSADYVPRSRFISNIASALAGGTVDLTPYTLLSNDVQATISASTTLTVPTANLAPLMARDLTLVIKTLGSGQVLTFGTGFNTTTATYVANGTGQEAVFRFEFNPFSAQWDEVSRAIGLPSVRKIVTTTVSGLATIDPSPAAGDEGFVTDATACTFGATLTGSGSTKCKAYYDGSAWKGG